MVNEIISILIELTIFIKGFCPELNPVYNIAQPLVLFEFLVSNKIRVLT